MNGQLSASDVMALTRDNDGFGGVGLIILLFIFLMAISGGNWGFGNGATALGQSDLQNSLYFQSQDNAIRGLAQGQCALTDTVLNSKYDSALLMKDASQQLSNSIAGISNQINNQTNTILSAINQTTIDNLRDKLAVTRDELSNVRQTAVITENILSNLATTAPKPPCYYSCCRCNQTSL